METTKTDTATKTPAASKKVAVSTVEKLEKLRLELAALEAQHEEEVKARLTALPAELGYKNARELITALLPFTRGLTLVEGTTPKPSIATVGGLPDAPKKEKGKRAKVTDAMRTEIVNLLRDTGMTAKQVAEKFGVSMPTVNNIKKAAGLVKKKK